MIPKEILPIFDTFRIIPRFSGLERREVILEDLLLHTLKRKLLALKSLMRYHLSRSQSVRRGKTNFNGRRC